MNHPESAAQQALVVWIKYQYPNILFTASTQEGARSIQAASRRKKMGYRAGTPDLAIYEHRGIWHGMFIEMKADKHGVISEQQRDFLNALKDRGYYAVVAHGLKEAQDYVTGYLNILEDK